MQQQHALDKRMVAGGGAQAYVMNAVSVWCGQIQVSIRVWYGWCLYHFAFVLPLVHHEQLYECQIYECTDCNINCQLQGAWCDDKGSVLFFPCPVRSEFQASLLVHK